MIVMDGFLPDYPELRAHCDQVIFSQEINEVDGATYPAISFDVPESVKQAVIQKIEHKQGFTVKPKLTFFRANPEGAPEPYQAHNDSNMGDYTFILYMNRQEHCTGGTSFVEHKLNGVLDCSEVSETVWLDDCNTYDAWQKVGHCRMRSNRALFFDAEIMHRGEPPQGFGSDNEDMRMILVCFYDRAFLQRTTDSSRVEKILKHPEIWPLIADDQNIDTWMPPMGEEYHYLMLPDDGGLFILHPDGDDLEIHANVLPDHRENAYEAGQAALHYGFMNLNASRIVCEIPPEYPNVYHFTLNSGLKDSGMRNGNHFLTLEREQWAL